MPTPPQPLAFAGEAALAEYGTSQWANSGYKKVCAEGTSNSTKSAGIKTLQTSSPRVSLAKLWTATCVPSASYARWAAQLQRHTPNSKGFYSIEEIC